MSKIETKWACGNFLVALTAEPTGEQELRLQECGLRFLGQRVSEVDKVLGAFTKDAAGKSKRIAGWKRGDVDYTAELAEKLSEVFGTLAFPDESTIETLVEVTEYVPTTGEPKYKEEKEIMLRHESAGDLEAWLAEKIGYTGASHTEDDEDYHPAALAAVKVYKQNLLKNA